MSAIGFVGIGLMGSRMAGRLLEAGHRLVVHNRTREKAEPLLALGARWADSSADAALRAGVMWTMLSTPDIVEAAATGVAGFLTAMRPGTLWIDSSTVDPLCSRRMAAAAAERGVRFLDAPVSGSTGAAETGELLFLVGGGGADVEAARPLFEVLGRGVIHAGPHGQGAALKLVFNQILGTALLGTAEAVVLGEALGFDRKGLFAALESCAVLPTGLRDRMKSSINDGTHEPGFPLRWMEKDLRLAIAAAADAGATLPMTDAARSVYGLARGHGWGDKAQTAVSEFLAGRRPSPGTAGPEGE